MESKEVNIIGRQIYHFKSIGSTNEHALKLIAKSKPIEGTVISADFQYAGKGQRNKIWQSEDSRNLLMSIILYPGNLKVSRQFYLSMFVANAIHSFLVEYSHLDELKIKWPNDIYYKDHKLGGILIQNILKGDFLDASVVGIGLNLNQLDFENDLVNPISLCQISGKEIDREDLKHKLLGALDRWYKKLDAVDMNSIKDYFEKNLYKLGESMTIEHSEGSSHAVILGVDDNGKLLVNDNGLLCKLSR